MENDNIENYRNNNAEGRRWSEGISCIQFLREMVHIVG